MKSSEKIPETMLAAGINEADGTIIIKSVPVPEPGNGDVLVKIFAAPINPSDIARIKHIPETERKEFIAGIEGSGRVVAHGKGILPRLWMGKRVACSSFYPDNGTWAEYMVTRAMSCIPLPDKVTDVQGSMLLVNPLTAVAFFEIARKNKHKAIINTASSSALGRFIEYLAEENNIPLIQVVRSDAQVNTIGKKSRFVLNSNWPDFEQKLSQLAHELNATLALDAIGGEMTRKLLVSVPYGSTVMVYGNLSGENPETHHRSLVTDNKTITGFYLVNWLKEQNLLTTLSGILKARKLIAQHVTIHVRETRPLKEVNQSVNDYFASMSLGKIVLTPE